MVEFVPDQSIFSSGAGSGISLNAGMRSTGGEAVVAYLSSPTTVALNMNKITASKVSGPCGSIRKPEMRS